MGFTYNNKVFKPSVQKKSHYKLESSSKMSHVLFLEACRPDQINTEIKVGNKRYGPLSYHIAKTLAIEPISTDGNKFVANIRSTILKEGYWPNNQNLVTETSY